MESKILEAAMVTCLMIGYFVLWKFRKLVMLRQHSVNPEVLYSDSMPSQIFFSFLIKSMTAYIVIYLVVHYTETFQFKEVFFLKKDIFNFLGFMMGLFGLFLCWKAQKEMGESWRVGIDRENKTNLITTGVYKIIRNPTYSGFFLICIGTFFIVPTIGIIVWIIVLYISIEFQVRIEEEFLADNHGDQYTRYYHTTKRYIPHIY